MLTLECTGGPYGDQTYAYNVIMDRPMTLREFVDAAVARDTRDWGSIVMNNDMILSENDIEFKYGKITKAPDNVQWDRIVTGAVAHGGWSLMYYYPKFQ